LFGIIGDIIRKEVYVMKMTGIRISSANQFAVKDEDGCVVTVYSHERLKIEGDGPFYIQKVKS